jgi:2,4-dienoyl-CoA reductase-like NADH-dependent reductase (Old Yellow Enzyme family)
MARSLSDTVDINGKITLPNRLVRSATWEGMCDESGAPGPRLEALYRTLVRGGIGLIITGYTFVRSDGKQLPGKMGIDNDALLPPLKRLTHAVHQEGGMIFCQLVHAGGQTSTATIGTTPLAPSAVSFPAYPEMPKAMTLAEIAEIVAAFAAGARRAQEAGFDGVQLHGAHGYLINQFLSPLTNRREDQYGGSLENRLRFLCEVCTSVRQAVGTAYPVTIKLTAGDNLPGGFVVQEALEAARRLEDLGIDAIEISSGTAASGKLSPVRQGINSEEQEGYNAPFARVFTQALKIPVMVVGGLRSCAATRELLWEGSADLFSFSRPLIREPDLPRRWQEDEGHRSTCISCNGCFKPGLKEGGIRCVIDGIEAENRTVPV